MLHQVQHSGWLELQKHVSEEMRIERLWESRKEKVIVGGSWWRTAGLVVKVLDWDSEELDSLSISASNLLGQVI